MILEIPDSLRKLNSMSACPIYAVGGFVRNKIAGLGETDIDIAGPAAPEALGISRRYQTKIVNYKLGTAIIRYGDDKFEYTPTAARTRRWKCASPRTFVRTQCAAISRATACITM